jgi:hypothetical protein
MDVEATFFKKKLKNILDDSSVLFRNIKTEKVHRKENLFC